jgi:hypothetical protein
MQQPFVSNGTVKTAATVMHATIERLFSNRMELRSYKNKRNLDFSWAFVLFYFVIATASVV